METGAIVGIVLGAVFLIIIFIVFAYLNSKFDNKSAEEAFEGIYGEGSFAEKKAYDAENGDGSWMENRRSAKKIE